MKKIIIWMIASLMIIGCHHEKKEISKLAQLAATDTIKPKVNIKVNKQYDDKGNLLRYDSAYSYMYSSPGFNLNKSITPDSLYPSFMNPFYSHYRSFMDTSFNNIFFNDSLYKYDFFGNDYFLNRYRLNMQRFENMFRQMDTLKNNMLNKEYPEGQLKKK